MMDYEYMFAMTLQQKMRERVIGKIFCAVRDDILYVKIESRGNLTFEIEFDNFSERFLNGFSTDYAMYEVLRKYERFIRNRYFIKDSA